MPTEKSQNTRLVDVFLLGPFMVWFGTSARHNLTPRALLVTAGVMTVLYNGQNYIHVADPTVSEASDTAYALWSSLVFVLAYNCL